MKAHPVWGTILFLLGLMWIDIGQTHQRFGSNPLGPYIIAAIFIAGAITVFFGRR